MSDGMFRGSLEGWTLRKFSKVPRAGVFKGGDLEVSISSTAVLFVKPCVVKQV